MLVESFDSGVDSVVNSVEDRVESALSKIVASDKRLNDIGDNPWLLFFAPATAYQKKS